MHERNQALQQYTGWLYTVARNMTDGPLRDDLAQEGYVAMWRAMGTHNPDSGPLDWWLKHAAINRMRSVLATGKMTTDQGRRSTVGYTTKKGTTTREKITSYTSAHPLASGVEIASALGISQSTLSYHRSKMGTVETAQHLTGDFVSMDEMLENGWELEAASQLENIAFSYHAGEIYQALDVLTPAQRRYVIARFWDKKSFAELEEMFGYHPHSLWTHARPKLVLRLAYLRELVDA